MKHVPAITGTVERRPSISDPTDHWRSQTAGEQINRRAAGYGQSIKEDWLNEDWHDERADNDWYDDRDDNVLKTG